MYPRLRCTAAITGPIEIINAISIDGTAMDNPPLGVVIRSQIIANIVEIVVHINKIRVRDVIT
jgi:hypothetical protein